MQNILTSDVSINRIINDLRYICPKNLPVGVAAECIEHTIDNDVLKKPTGIIELGEQIKESDLIKYF